MVPADINNFPSLGLKAYVIWPISGGKQSLPSNSSVVSHFHYQHQQHVSLWKKNYPQKKVLTTLLELLCSQRRASYR